MRHARCPWVLPALLAVLAAGCSTGPDYKRPAVEVPAAYRAPPDAAAAPTPGGAELLDSAWWQSFGDPQLDMLVRTAVAENKDLRIAAQRIEQFDAFLQVSQAAGLPQAAYNASRTRDTLSENRQIPLVVGARPVDNAYVVGAGAAWEVDLWGKLSRADEAAFAELVAREENRRALVQSLVSEVAAGYVRLLTLDRELELLLQAIAAHEETLRLAQARFDAGGSGELPVVQARVALQDRLAEVPSKRAEITTLEHRLNGLVGQDPGPIVRGKAIAELQLPRVPAGLPADLLAQRPDVRQSEQELVAANARIGVAKAQYLPSISLTASSGFASNELSKLTLLSSNFGSFGVQLLGPIFSAGRIAGQVREAEAQQKQAATAFLRAVQTALRETEDALTQHARAGEQLALRAQHVQALVEQRAMAQRRFDGGYGSYFDVLGAERELAGGLQLENQARREQFTSLIAIYKAMGGGWSLPDVTASRPSSTDNRP